MFSKVKKNYKGSVSKSVSEACWLHGVAAKLMFFVQSHVLTIFCILHHLYIEFNCLIIKWICSLFQVWNDERRGELFPPPWYRLSVGQTLMWRIATVSIDRPFFSFCNVVLMKWYLILKCVIKNNREITKLLWVMHYGTSSIITE